MKYYYSHQTKILAFCKQCLLGRMASDPQPGASVVSCEVKLCTYHHWFGRPSNLRFERYYDLPMGISKLRALVQFRLGSHTLPIEQGCFARPAVPRHLCDTQAVGDELHCVFDCPHFSDIRAQFPGLFLDTAHTHTQASGPCALEDGRPLGLL